jgi:hypothetical protein
MLRGALLGLLIDLIAIPARVLVLLFAIGGRYPWWLLTPDDPVSPFGSYESTVRSVYARFGRYVGDVYWLAWRNVLFGLAYRFKPARFKGLTDYRALPRSLVKRGRLTIYSAAGLGLWQYRVGGFELLAGWMTRGAVLDPDTPRRPINMEFRPVFSVRRAG